MLSKSIVKNDTKKEPVISIVKLYVTISTNFSVPLFYTKVKRIIYLSFTLPFSHNITIAWPLLFLYNSSKSLFPASLIIYKNIKSKKNHTKNDICHHANIVAKKAQGFKFKKNL
jgi:hypothetical protein